MKAIYQAVTNQIIAELEVGAIPWTQPWKNQRTGGVMLQNAATGRAYSGINIPILWHAASVNGFPSHEWMTFKQALEKKVSVRKGEKGTQVVFTKRVAIKQELNEDDKQISMLRTYFVFNVSQIDGLTVPAIKESLNDQHERSEHFIAATKADIRIGGSKACFVPSHDFIAMPPREAFRDAGNYYAVNLPELGHWSGHEKRLNRDLTNRFGTKAYAAEELIAELTAAFLCAHLGIEGELRHAGYVQDWISLLKEDARAIFTAASKASQAANYLRSFSETMEDSDNG
jgi:antirestriction protein ArdC